MDRLLRREDETLSAYHKRLVYGKMEDGTLSDVDYAELSPFVFGKEYSSDNARRMMKGSYLTLQALQEDREREYDNTDLFDELELKKAELYRERKKMQTEKLEYDRLIREMARDEMIVERLSEAIGQIKPLPVYEDMVTKVRAGCNVPASCDRVGILAFGDEHYGSAFEIRGLHGELINSYSTKIAEDRMDNLLLQTIRIVEREQLDTLYVFNMGDFTDGVLRVGQLKKLQLGVVESTVRYMEYLSNWLNELSRCVQVKYQMVHGNHSELRMLGQPKGAFKDENMGKIVAAYIKMRLANNERFEFHDNPSGLIFESVFGFNILGIHGEVRDMERALRDFSAVYSTPIDYLLAGHLHHAETCTAGYRKEVIRVPSIVGIDDYAMSLNKSSNAGATLFVLQDMLGKCVEYPIYLN